MVRLPAAVNGGVVYALPVAALQDGRQQRLSARRLHGSQDAGIVVGAFGIECCLRQPYPAAMLSANGKRLGEQDVGLSVVARVEPFAVDGVLQVVHQLEFGVVVLASLLQLCASGIHLQQ